MPNAKLEVTWIAAPAALLAGALHSTASCDDAALHASYASAADAPAPAPVSYFLVAEWPGGEVHGDSYVLPVVRAEDIEHARDLIELGPQAAGRAVAVARVGLGADGINRDLRAPGRPAWSWHVTEMLGFADCSVEILDGWPGWLEHDPEGWMQNTPPNGGAPDTAGTVGFWRYTVVEELPGYPRALPGAAAGRARAD